MMTMGCTKTMKEPIVTEKVVHVDKIVPADTHTHYNYEARAISNNVFETSVWKNPITYGVNIDSVISCYKFYNRYALQVWLF